MIFTEEQEADHVWLRSHAAAEHMLTQLEAKARILFERTGFHTKIALVWGFEMRDGGPAMAVAVVSGAGTSKDAFADEIDVHVKALGAFAVTIVDEMWITYVEEKRPKGECVRVLLEHVALPPVGAVSCAEIERGPGAQPKLLAWKREDPTLLRRSGYFLPPRAS